ncbi:MAG: RNA-guided endonuclease InsQ/TnpB family protein [Vulcanimicrobiaceae bacterium]
MKANRVVTIQLKDLPAAHGRIRAECARLWNRMVGLHRYFRKRHLPWPTEAQFKAHFKGRFALHSQTVQGIVERFFANVDTTRTNRKNGATRARYPHKSKRFVVPVWKPQAIKLVGRRLELSMGKGRHPLRIKVPALPHGEIAQVQLGFGYLYVTLVSEVALSARESGVAAGDLGIIHLVAMTDGVVTQAVVGRGLRSVIQGHNKAKAALAALRSKCLKSSRRWKKLGQAVRKQAQRRQNLQRNLLHHAANVVSDFCAERRIGTFYVGDITEMNRSKHKKRSRRLNQEVGNAPFAQFIAYLAYKLAKIGAVVGKGDEAYTSQTCPVCLTRTKPSGRVYRCKACSFSAARDQVGSWNFLNKCVNGSIQPGAMVPQDRVKYLRPVVMRKRREQSVVDPLATGSPQGVLLPMTLAADDVAVGASQSREVLGTARSAA